MLRRSPGNPDLERELRFHLELAERTSAGKSHAPAESARSARAPGRFPEVMEALRDQRNVAFRLVLRHGQMFGHDGYRD